MRETFERIVSHLNENLSGDEILSCYFRGEDSDFVRFNHSAVRQAGAVRQMYLEIELISGRRHAKANAVLSGERDEDGARLAGTVEDLREILPLLPEDPHLIYAEEICSSERVGENSLPPPEESVGAILDAGRGKDMVGIYAAGGVHAGFANSLGQRNWFSSFSFHLDWTYYHRADKAVKSRYAGRRWEAAEFRSVADGAGEHLKALARPSRTLDRGSYRVYLSPAAVGAFLGMVSWSGFGLRARRTKQSSLLKMEEEGKRLHPGVHLAENTREGLGPGFQEQGFPKPPRVPLIESGRLAECLVSPRSGREWEVSPNGASERETPEALDLASGDIPYSHALERLERGIYIGDLWYLNYSDLNSCRMTGLTRFATFWVEGGKSRRRSTSCGSMRRSTAFSGKI